MLFPFEYSRFMRYVNIPEDKSQCWAWSGAKRLNRWGAFRMHSDAGGSMAVGRASWLFHRGEIPDGMHVLHSCDNGLCVNPDHLWLGTHSENMRDKTMKGRAGRKPILSGGTSQAPLSP